MKLCLALLALLFLPFPSFGAELDVKAIDALVEKARMGFEVPGIALVIVKDDQVVHLKGYGQRETGGKDEVTPDTQFAIASCSKAFCALLIAMQADEGKIGWDDPVRKHIPFFKLHDPLADQNVTIRDLLCHRTGLSRNDLLRYRAPWSHEEMIRRMAELKPHTSFRSTWEYNNLCFLTAGYAAADVDKTTYAELLRKRIFVPLGMKTASGSADEVEKNKVRATPHLKEAPDDVSAIPRYMQEVDGAGGINASARDLGNWLRFQLGDGTWEGKRLVSRKNLDEMHMPQMIVRATATSDVTVQKSYGLGWSVQDYRGRLLVDHGGSIDGFRTRVMLLPKEKIGLAILCNLGGNTCPEALGNTLMDQLLGAPQRDWIGNGIKTDRKNQQVRANALVKLEQERKKDTKPSHALAAFVGTYKAPAYGEMTIALEKGALVLNYSSFSLKLEHYHLDSFLITDIPLAQRAQWEKEVITFRLDVKGEIAGVRFASQEFTRKK